MLDCSASALVRCGQYSLCWYRAACCFLLLLTGAFRLVRDHFLRLGFERGVSLGQEQHEIQVVEAGEFNLSLFQKMDSPA